MAMRIEDFLEKSALLCGDQDAIALMGEFHAELRAHAGLDKLATRSAEAYLNAGRMLMWLELDHELGPDFCAQALIVLNAGQLSLEVTAYRKRPGLGGPAPLQAAILHELTRESVPAPDTDTSALAYDIATALIGAHSLLLQRMGVPADLAETIATTFWNERANRQAPASQLSILFKSGNPTKETNDV